MDIKNQISSHILSKNILKEIELLPIEFREKSEELNLLQTELNELRSNYSKKENQINVILQDIIKNEDNLTINLEAMSKIKMVQKKIISSLNEESFINFKKKFYTIKTNYQNAILLFLKYEGDFKEELNSLLIRPEDLHQLLLDSYYFYKSLEEFDQEKYDLNRNKINNLLNEEIKNDREKRNNNYNYNNKNKLGSPFDDIITFINNTFKIIDINKYNNIMKNKIKELSSNKNSLFIQNKLLEETIKKKEEKIKKVNSYTKYMNNILIKYQNYFGNKNNNSNNNDNKNSINNGYDDKDNKEDKDIFIEFKKDINNINNSSPNRNSLLLKSKIMNEEKININVNDKIRIKSLIKMTEEENSRPNNNQSFNVEIKKNNFYHAINICQNNQENEGNINNTTSKINNGGNNNPINSPNNIKIISIINKSNNSPQYLNTTNNIIPYNKSLNLNSLTNDNLNQQNFSAINSKLGKKIKIGSLSLYQSSTSKKYKNKIIKTNSFEQTETKKIIINGPMSNNPPNKSYIEINGYITNITNSNDNINKNLEYDLIRANDKCYYSLNNEIKTEDGFKSDKKQSGKKIIVDNMMSDSKVIKNNESHVRKNFYLSPGIYNNNRKIIKMFEMNKMKDKSKK